MAQTDFTISDVLAWARTKPADEAYEFCEPTSCAIAQFGQATGRPDLVSVADIRDLPVQFAWALWQAAVQSDTFGELVESLEKLCPETPVEPLSATWATADAYMADIELALS